MPRKRISSNKPASTAIWGNIETARMVINSNPRLMQLVQLKGGRVDPALRKLIESQVRDDPLTLVRQALRNAGERPM